MHRPSTVVLGIAFRPMASSFVLDLFDCDFWRAEKLRPKEDPEYFSAAWDLKFRRLGLEESDFRSLCTISLRFARGWRLRKMGGQ